MKKRMNNKELSQFYHDLGLFAKSGLTLERGLDTMKKGKKGFIFLMMDGIQHFIAGGKALWEGMSQYPEFFDEFQVIKFVVTWSNPPLHFPGTFTPPKNKKHDCWPV